MKRKVRPGRCPVCSREYTYKNYRTEHHVFPRSWYHGAGPLVEMCSDCHFHGFNRDNPMTYVWTTKECIKRLAEFCAKKGRNAFALYPQLHSYV